MRHALLALGHLWAAPTTALGLLLALSTGARWLLCGRDGHLVMAGTSRPWRWWSSRWGMAAVTIGAVTICAGRTSARLFRHERRHQRQALILGPLYLPIYVLLCAYGPLHGGHWYRDHPLELDARAAEGDACPS